MGFWRQVARELRQRWWLVVLIIVAGVIHTIFTGFSWATVALVALILCVSRSFLTRCWRRSIPSVLLGVVAGLTLIFLIETYLGISTWISGSFDPLKNPLRKPVFLEGPLIRLLGWLYSVPLPQYLELILTAWAVIAFIYFIFLRNRRPIAGDERPSGLAGCAECLKKFLEYASGIVAVLSTLVFANPVNLKTTGLNSFASFYDKTTKELGANAAAIKELRRQVMDADDLNTALLKHPTPSSKKFIDATNDLIDVILQLEEAQEEASKIELAKYTPSENPLPDWDVSLPKPASSEPELRMQLIMHVGELADVQRQAESDQRDADGLLKHRDEALSNLATAISIALERANQLTPAQKAIILQGIVQRLARLVARDGINSATDEILARVQQLRQQLDNQRRANDARRAEVEQFRQNLQAYMTQQKACLDLTNAAANFLLSDPDGRALMNKLIAYQRRGETRRGSPLLQRPEWPEPSNNALENQFLQDISQQLFNQPNPPNNFLQGGTFVNALRDAFRAAGGGVEAPGFELLLSWIDDACGRGQSADSVTAMLRQRAVQMSPL